MSDVSLRPLEEGDLELVLAWRSNPCIYEHFREQDGPIRWEEHRRWFENRPPKRRDLVIEYEGRRVGVVSLSEDGEVGIYVGETALWGEGIATAALQQVTESADSRLTAHIHRDNESSRRLFERCGFECIKRGEWLRYEYES